MPKQNIAALTRSFASRQLSQGRSGRQRSECPTQRRRVVAISRSLLAAVIVAVLCAGTFLDEAYAYGPKRFSREQNSTSDFDRRYLEAAASQPALRCTANSAFLQGMTSLSAAEVSDKGRQRFAASASERSGIRLTGATASRSAKLAINEDPSKVLYKAFLKMNCIEFGMLGANYETAERNYSYIGTKSGDGIDAPSVRGRPLLIYKNGGTIVAVEPKSGDTWFSHVEKADTASLSWTKLTHRR